jgi:RIO kinase 1
MDIKNVSDFFRRKGVDVLSEKAIFGFVTSEKSPVDMDGMAKWLEQLSATRPETADEDAEVDAEVFRQQYIPQNLGQVYDVERDVDQVVRGGQKDLVYQSLLADEATTHAQTNSPPYDDPAAATGDATMASSSSSTEGDSDSEKDPFAKKPPRGRRFEDKNAKKEHKEAVKEEKREQRKHKIPKHIKKKLISTSKRKH